MSTDRPGTRLPGIVKFYNPRKGYGFVTRAEGPDVFFHLTHFRTPTAPAPGMVVQFTLGQNREGLTAEDITIVPVSELETYLGTITHLTDDGGAATTPDNFVIHFARSDYLPHNRADALRLGDEIELFFLHQDDNGWRAKVAQPPDWRPDERLLRPDRRDGDDEDENRRLLGILYKTDLDEEATHAARVLGERNLRAALSALASRLFDRRLETATRLLFVDHLTRIYFDDECQDYLERLARWLAEAVTAEDEETNPAAVRALELLLADDFPLRWSQYLLPFGLALLRCLSSQTSCRHLLETGALAGPAEAWLGRVCRHVEQRRTGHGYVLTIALTCFDELWQRTALQEPLRRIMARLLVATDAEGLANQIYHLRDKLSPEFLPVLLPLLSQHPDLPAALHARAQCEIFSHWLEELLTLEGDHLSTDTLACVLPLLEEVRGQLADDQTLQRLLRPITDSLTGDEVVRLLTSEDLPERAVWACLRHLDRQGELQGLLADRELRGLVTGWLRRTATRPSPEPPREQEVNTALKLIDSLRGSVELGDELADIGTTLFAGLHDRVARADSEQLIRLLDEFDLAGLPDLTASLARRLLEPTLGEAARRALLEWFAERGEALATATAALVAWAAAPDDPERLNDLLTAAVACAAADPEAQTLGELIEDLLAEREISWHSGFITALETTPFGEEAARLEGCHILLPRRLFADPMLFAVHQWVRLIHRRGRALGVYGAAPPPSEFVCGRLAGPLMVDERDALVGLLIDSTGARCYFEVAQMISGRDLPLREGDILIFSRWPAPGQPGFEQVAFHLRATCEPADWPLLLATVAEAADEAVALGCLRRALSLGEVAAWPAAWARVPAARRAALREALDETERERLAALVAEG